MQSQVSVINDVEPSCRYFVICVYPVLDDPFAWHDPGINIPSPSHLIAHDVRNFFYPSNAASRWHYHPRISVYLHVNPHPNLLLVGEFWDHETAAFSSQVNCDPCFGCQGIHNVALSTEAFTVPSLSAGVKTVSYRKGLASWSADLNINAP